MSSFTREAGVQSGRQSAKFPGFGPEGSASRCGVRDCAAIPGEAVVETECTRTESRDLEQAARDHDVLEKVNHLVLVGEVGVERRCGSNREYCLGDRDRPNLIACD